ncbi:atrial natriuretic peptide receptor 1-like [Mizuhopecten yessoensis]|uniref:atrial natriuretic peptide receptor 1-like n=1 Tax=Mizuhopecten yessoensis TaxID=6573 RepID=UPI000B457CA7|nr:atrial natriuretic peptide receptor 1-like [Mizuhopecten yessoensis]
MNSLQYVSAVTEIKVGVLLMTEAVEPFDLRRVKPALDIAFEFSESYYGIKYNPITLNYTGFCPKQSSIGHFSELYYEHNVHAVIGPACSETILSIGRLAQYLHTPMVSGVGDLIIRSPSDMYTTFTRMSYNLGKFSTSVMSLMSKYGWRHISIIYDVEYIFFELAGVNLVRDFVNHASWPRPLDLQFGSSKLSDPGTLLTTASRQSRVFVIFCNAELFRDFMYRAYQLGMADGGYVFLTMELFPSDWLGDYKDVGVTRAYESALVFTLHLPKSGKYLNFASEVKLRASRDYGFDFGDETVNYFITAFHDGVLYLSEAFNRTLADGQNITDGLKVSQKLWNNTYSGISGTIAIDEMGDRIADFDFLDMTDPVSKSFNIVGAFRGFTQKYEAVAGIEILWPNGLPVDIPVCGFENELCISAESDDSKLVLPLTLSLGGVLLKLKFEMESVKTPWLVTWVDVVLSKADRRGGSFLSKSRLSMASAVRTKTTDVSHQQLFTSVGNCMGNVVAIRKLSIPTVELNKTTLLEFHKLYSVQHQNLVRFVGACLEPENCAILMEYCSRGSLQDIIENDDINLDWTFRYSLIWDILKGMQYIENSPLKYHGRLSSTNCVIDSRFMLKLTDFGIPSVYFAERQAVLKNQDINYYKLLWTAPEILREDAAKLNSLGQHVYQKGDVYGFGIILQEIATRSTPYSDMNLNADDIIHRVITVSTIPFRPNVSGTDCSNELLKLIEICWDETANDRPTFDGIALGFKKINSANSSNIMNNLLKRMEQYADNLESLVQERTDAYLEEKKKAVELLHRLLPASVADQLEAGKNVLPETYDCVTIYFSDIVGFTNIASDSTPMQVITLLNELYTHFDRVIDKLDVYKVETIGDAYMVVSGLPTRNGNLHAINIAKMALEIRQTVKTFTIKHLPDTSLNIRIGLHSGSVVAGVVGLTMPRYCLFGDTVNTASRMESTSEAMCIQISSSTRKILETFNEYEIDERGEVEIKGKGLMRTSWLIGTKEADEEIAFPDPDTLAK